MAVRNLFPRAALAVFLLALPLNAQKVLLLPNSGSTVSVATEDPFAASTPINANTGVFTVLSNPAGTRYFFLSSANVTITDASGNPTQSPLALGLPIKAGAVTPDGRRLLVAAGSASAGTLYIFDISLGSAVQTGAVPVGNNPSGVAGTVDSTAALVVTVSGLSSVDVASNTVTATLPLPGVAAPASGVVGGPNGFFYVNAQGALYEINPRGMTILHTITVDAFPTKALFSPDGRSIVLANPSASNTSQPALMVVDVASHAIANRLNWWGLQLNKLIWAPGDRLFALSTNQRLIQFDGALGGLAEACFPQLGACPGTGSIPTVMDAFTSKELPSSGTGPGARYLYVAAPAALYRFDLSAGANPPVATVALGTLPRSGAYFLPVSHSTTPELTKSGDGQTLAVNAVSLPLVVRAVDELGRPVSGTTVAFTSATATFVGQTMTTTNSDGLAQAIIQAPPAAGAFAVLATVGTVGTEFNLTATAGGGGGGGGEPGPGPGGSGLIKVLGEGQVYLGNSFMIEPLTVYLQDADGRAVSDAPVTFALDGPGQIFAPDCTLVALGTFTCATDANGLASVELLAPDVFDREASWIETHVTASTTLSDGTTQTLSFLETGVPATAYGTTGSTQGQLFLTPGYGGTVTVQAGQTAAAAIQMSVFARSGPSVSGPMPGVGIHLRTTQGYDPTAAAPAVHCAGGTPLSNTNGLASCDVVAPVGTPQGTYPLWVVIGGNIAYQVNVVVTPAPPVVRVPTTAAVVSGDGNSVGTGQAFPPLIAVVRDQLGAVMPNIATQWAVISGPATLAAPTGVLTDANGRTSTGIVAGAAAGAVVVRMTAGAAPHNPAVTFNLTVTPTIGSVTKVAGDGQSVVIGQAFQPISVLVKDTLGNALPGIAVSFDVTGGVATPTSTVATTNTQGIAAATFSSTNTAGAITINAAANGQSANFTLTARLPGPVLTSASFLNGASFQPGVPIGGVVAIKGEGLTTGLTIPAGSCLSGTPDGNLQRGLPTRVAGMEIWFSTRIAPIFGICVNADGTEQVNVQAPFELAPAVITVLVKTGIGTAEVDTYVPNVTVSAAHPGIFERNVDANTRIALAQRPDGTIVSPTNPAKAGETIRLYVNGIGWVLDSERKQVQTNQPGYPGQLPWNVDTSVTLNNAGVSGVSAEFAQNLIGVFIVNFQVPAQNASATVPIFVSVTPLGQSTINSLVSHIPVSQ